MKKIRPGFNLKTLWICLFLPFFLSIPVSLLGQEFFLAALFIGFICVISKYEIPRFPLVLFLSAFVLRLAVILMIPTPAQSDFSVLLDASRQIIAGERNYLDTSYFQL